MTRTKLQDGALKEFYLARGLLLKLHMDLLYACDLDCLHCYLDEKLRARRVGADVLTDILEQGAALGALQVTFSGGEVFLRTDLFTILEAARRLRYHIRLKTHGGNVTREHAERLAALGVAAVDFSVYALDSEVHEGFTRKAGSLAATLRGIDLVSAAGVEVTVKCSVTRTNLGHYRELVEHFESRGIEATFNARIRGTNSGKTTTYPLNVDQDEKVQVELYRLGRIGGLPDEPRPVPPPDKAYFCTAGRTSIYIAPDLRVYPCTAFPLDLGSLRTSSLAELWEGPESLAAIRKATRADIPVCQSCEARPYCSYCPGVAFIESGGDYLAPPEVICRESFAKLEAARRWAEGERPAPHAAARSRKGARFVMARGATDGAPRAGCGIDGCR